MPDDAGSPLRAAPPLPFVPPGAVLTASGRQALSLVAADLRARGITTILAPVLHCPTMLEPFQLEGLHVELLPVAEDLLLDPDALTEALATTLCGASQWSILHSETFGNRAGPALATALGRARAEGHAVVRDETHSFLDLAGEGSGPVPPPRLPGDAPHHRIASLRKWLPLPDGAWATGVPRRRLPRREVDDAVASAGLAALAAEAAGREAGELWVRAEELVDRAVEPAAMSAQAVAILAGLDGVRLARARGTAAHGLRCALRGSGGTSSDGFGRGVGELGVMGEVGVVGELGVEVVNESACFVAVRVRHPEAVSHALAAAGIHQPLRWEAPAGLAGHLPWPNGLVTLPPEGDPGTIVDLLRVGR